MIHSEAARSRIVPRVLRSKASHQRRLRSSPDHRQIDQIRRTKKPLKLHFQNSMYKKLCNIEPCKTHLSGLRVTPIFYFLLLRAFPAYIGILRFPQSRQVTFKISFSWSGSGVATAKQLAPAGQLGMYGQRYSFSSPFSKSATGGISYFDPNIPIKSW